MEEARYETLLLRQAERYDELLAHCELGESARDGDCGADSIRIQLLKLRNEKVSVQQVRARLQHPLLPFLAPSTRAHPRLNPLPSNLQLRTRVVERVLASPERFHSALLDVLSAGIRRGGDGHPVRRAPGCQISAREAASLWAREMIVPGTWVDDVFFLVSLCPPE